MPKFPFTNYHELNLDWILKKVEALFTASEENARTIRTYDTRLTRAEQTATSAATAATSAQQLADAAAATAGDALSVAGTADAKADSALTAATSAASAASGALTVAQEARQIAGNAQSAAADAGALANDASNAAAAAQTTADTNAGNIATLQTTVETISGKVSDIDNKADVIIDSASGITASFADGADDMPIKSLVVNIDPVQAGSGDPSPTNVRPITGRTGCSVVRTGKNLLENKKVVRGSAREILIGQDITSGYPIYLKAGVTYTISNNLGRPCYYQISGTTTEIACNGTFSVINDCFVKIWIYLAADQTIDSLTWWQLEIGSTPTSYEPYQGNQISITFPTEAGTVYGGTLDVTNGVLTVDRAFKQYTGATSEKWTYSSWTKENTLAAYANNDLTDAKHGVSGDNYMCITSCNELPLTTYANLQLIDVPGITITGGGYQAYVSIRVPKTIASDVSALQTYLASNPLEIVYELATPLTYQLTPQQINTLLGSNNIYSDVGSIADVQYPADTKLYIDGKIAELQALVLEN